MQDSEGFTQLAMNEMGTDREAGIFAEFYYESILNESKSTEENRPIFEDTSFIRITVSGNKNSIIERPVRIGHLVNHDNNRFRAEYAAFLKGEQAILEGTPLNQWGAISNSQANELKHFNVRTVEQLASMTDGNAQNFPSILALREQAKSFLKTALEGSQTSKLQAELSKRDDDIAAMKAQLAEVVKELGTSKKRSIAK
jgi:hypothetical protein|tara:strand:- start:1092 stop:1688 length:597 start_codon:yes stop_codon:yes gene_type:complete